MAHIKRKYQPIAITNFEPEAKKIRQDRKSLLGKKKGEIQMMTHQTNRRKDVE